jgi:hypothetical protein
MAIHTDLPIHRTGVQLLELAVAAQAQMPRTVKRTLGEKINQHCVDMLDLMAMANATRHAERTANINALLAHQRAVTVLMRVSYNSRYVSPKVWASSVELPDSIGKQGGGWLKSAANRRPAA